MLISGAVKIIKTGLEEAGDIYLYGRDDSAGRFARKGGYTNMGYSGYLLASIYDGKKWRKLQLNELIPYAKRSYRFAREKAEVTQRLAETILRWKGTEAVYVGSKRAFTVPSLVIQDQLGLKPTE